jgi:hypothetical protein
LVVLALRITAACPTPRSTRRSSVGAALETTFSEVAEGRDRRLDAVGDEAEEPAGGAAVTGSMIERG